MHCTKKVGSTFYMHHTSRRSDGPKMAQNLDLRCVLRSDPGTLGAGAKPRLESSIKKCTPHCICLALTAVVVNEIV